MPEIPDLIFEFVYDGDVHVLRNAPIGWDKVDLAHEIDDTFLTTWLKINSELKFVYDGADILRKIFYTGGSALLRIRKKNKFPIGSYSLKVNQKIDFKKYSDQNGIVSIGLLERGVASNIRTYLDVKYDIPVEDNAIAMNIGGIGVDESVQFVGVLVIPHIEQYIVQPLGFSIAPSVDIIDNTTSPDIVEVKTGFVPYTGSIGDFDMEFTYEIRNLSAVDILARFKGSLIDDTYSPQTPKPFTCFVFTSEGEQIFIQKNVPIIPTEGQNPYGEGTVTRWVGTCTFDVNIIMKPGVKYVLMFTPHYRLETFGTSTTTIDLNISYQTYTTDYTVKGLRADDLYHALLNKINPDTGIIATAPVLTYGLGKRIVVASGDCIRGILGATIQSSFRDFLETFKPQLFAGFKMYTDGSVKFDNLKNIQFNKYAYCGSLGTVKDATYEAIEEAYASGYKRGYNNNDYDKANGRDETNSEVDVSVVDSEATNIIEMISTYRADPRGVDQLMIDYRNDKTKDNTGDKDNFQFVVNELPNEDDGLYHLTGPEIFASVTGTSALGRIYNLELAPIFMFLRNSARVAIQFALKKTGIVKFETSKKNGDLVIVRNTGTNIYEKMAVTYDMMDAPLYLPVKCTFTSVLTDEIYDAVVEEAERQGGYISYIDRGEEINAFMVSHSYNLTNNNIKEFIVYLHPDTDVNKLIKIGAQ